MWTNENRGRYDRSKLLVTLAGVASEAKVSVIGRRAFGAILPNLAWTIQALATQAHGDGCPTTPGLRDRIKAAAEAEILAHPERYTFGSNKFFRLRGKGTSGGWVLGTMHAGAPGGAYVSLAVHQALIEASTAAFETDGEAWSRAVAQPALVAAMQYSKRPIGTARLDQLRSQDPSLDENLAILSISMEGLARLSTDEIIQRISNVGCVTPERFALTDNPVIDAVLYGWAISLDKPVKALEELGGLDVRYGDEYQAHAADIIPLLARRARDMAEFHLFMFSAYFDGRIDLAAAAERAYLARPEDEAQAEREQRLLVDFRNERFVRTLEPMLSQGKAFAAMGAAHVVGKRGVLARLQALGYEVIPVSVTA